MSTVLQCHACRRFAWGALDSDRCSAFPDGIPDAVWLGEVDHAAPVAGDGGVRRDPSPPRAEDIRLRRAMWGKRAVDRIDHARDPLGVLVMGIASAPGAPPVTPEALREAWRSTADAPAMLLVLLRAGRTAALARALQLASEQLALEGCDYNDDKGWLGVGLTLGTFATEASLANVRAAWSALASPFRDGYVTARTQLTLLRAMRRVVPEPPPVETWTATEAAGFVLEDGVVALGLARPRKALTIEDVVLLEPWHRVNSAESLEAELARELLPGHRLHGRTGLRAVARRADRDDVLFVDDTLAAVVHLTWSKETDPALPSADVYPSLELWVTQRMNADHDELVGPEARVFALEFRSKLSLEEILARLPDAPRWSWELRDSHWYGAYLSGRDDTTRVRIHVEKEAERFTLQADFVAPDTGFASAAGWLATTRAMAADSLLAAIDATDILSTTPEYDS